MVNLNSYKIMEDSSLSEQTDLQVTSATPLLQFQTQDKIRILLSSYQLE